MQGRPGGPPGQSRHLGNDLQLAARGDPLRRVGALCRQYDGRNSDGAGPRAQRSADRYSRPYRRPLSRTLRRQIAVSAATRRPAIAGKCYDARKLGGAGCGASRRPHIGECQKSEHCTKPRISPAYARQGCPRSEQAPTRAARRRPRDRCCKGRINQTHATEGACPMTSNLSATKPAPNFAIIGNPRAAREDPHAQRDAAVGSRLPGPLSWSR